MELNMMMRDQAKQGLQTQLDAAVTDGDTVKAREISDKIAALEVATAPKANAYGDAEIRAELNKLDWFGVDPVKSEIAVALGKSMDPKKFATAAAFAEALVKAVETKINPAAPGPKNGDEGADGDDGSDEDADGDDDNDDTSNERRAAPRTKKTDGPKDGDSGARGGNARRSGPWTKMPEAPSDVRREIQRQSEKFLSSNAPKEQRETFEKNALASHYQIYLRNKGKR